MYLNEKHFSFISSTDVCKISEPLRKLGISFFNHIRFYNDGSVLALTTDAEWLKFCLKNERPREGNILGLNSGIYLWTDILETEVILDAQNDFKIHHVIQFIEKQLLFTDVFAFGGGFKNSTLISFYFNNIDVLKNFISFFKYKAKTLINQADMNKFNTPEIMKVPSLDIAIKNYVLKNDKKIALYDVFHKGKLHSLTKRQLDCLRYISCGYSCKDVANILSVSPRTVETHVNILKNKLYCKNKKELVHFYMSSMHTS